jgi:ribosomal protein L3
MQTKWCYCCKTNKDVSLFGINRSKPDCLASECRECKRQKDKEYSAKHREEARKRAFLWYEMNKNNPEKMEKFKENQRKYRAKTKDKHAARQAKRRSLKQKATPLWLTQEQLRQIQTEYALSAWCSEVMNMKYHVDHIVPLKGKDVCGLHVPWNLQVIPAKTNLKKGNRYVG